MSAAWIQRVDTFLRGLTPATLILLLVFVGAVPWHLPGLAPVTPAFPMIAVYYWSIYRPDKLPFAATFALGLFHDLLTGTPIGLTALVLLLVQGIVNSQRVFFHNKPFLVVWWGFTLLVPVAALTSWVIGSIFLGAMVPPLPIIVQAALTILLYPVLAGVFSQIQFHFMQRL